MGLSLEWFVKSDNILMPGTSEDVEFLHDLPPRLLFRQKLFIDGFQSNKLIRKSVDSKVNLAKGSLTHNFSYLVELCWGSWCVICGLEGKFYLLDNFLINSWPRGEVRVCVQWFLSLNSLLNHFQLNFVRRWAFEVNCWFSTPNLVLIIDNHVMFPHHIAHIQGFDRLNNFILI